LKIVASSSKRLCLDVREETKKFKNVHMIVDDVNIPDEADINVPDEIETEFKYKF